MNEIFKFTDGADGSRILYILGDINNRLEYIEFSADEEGPMITYADRTNQIVDVFVPKQRVSLKKLYEVLKETFKDAE